MRRRGVTGDKLQEDQGRACNRPHEAVGGGNGPVRRHPGAVRRRPMVVTGLASLSLLWDAKQKRSGTGYWQDYTVCMAHRGGAHGFLGSASFAGRADARTRQHRHPVPSLHVTCTPEKFRESVMYKVYYSTPDDFKDISYLRTYCVLTQKDYVNLF